MAKTPVSKYHVPATHSEAVRLLDQLRSQRPRALAKLYGTNGPTPEQFAAWQQETKRIDGHIAAIRRQLFRLLDEANAAFRVRQATEQQASANVPAPQSCRHAIVRAVNLEKTFEATTRDEARSAALEYIRTSPEGYVVDRTETRDDGDTTVFHVSSKQQASAAPASIPAHQYQRNLSSAAALCLTCSQPFRSQAHADYLTAQGWTANAKLAAPDRPCSGGCGKLPSVTYADSRGQDWLCFACFDRQRQAEWRKSAEGIEAAARQLEFERALMTEALATCQAFSRPHSEQSITNPDRWTTHWYGWRGTYDRSVVKTPGQLAYEEDLARQPLHHDGTLRPTWMELERIYGCNVQAIRDSWERNPTPRAAVQEGGR